MYLIKCMADIHKSVYKIKLINDIHPSNQNGLNHSSLKGTTHDYLMVKDKYHEDIYYWYCERWKKKIKDGKGKALTRNMNGQHNI